MLSSQTVQNRSSQAKTIEDRYFRELLGGWGPRAQMGDSLTPALAPQERWMGTSSPGLGLRHLFHFFLNFLTIKTS